MTARREKELRTIVRWVVRNELLRLAIAALRAERAVMSAQHSADNIADLSALLRTAYGPSMKQQQRLATKLFRQFDTRGVRFSGGGYEFPARMAGATGG